MHLFPATGFDQSATTSVFLGVLVSWFFTETLGWVFVGLVVPGYLASLFLLDVRSASIDVAEAALTYGVAKLLGELLSATGWTSRVFGRERFLLVLVVSVLVRLGVEAAILPLLVPRATWAYSIGLVVVPLLANACWKTGLFSGFVQRGVPTLLVYLLLRFLLLPHTNLSLGGFYLATENVASSFLSSPRAYLMLLTGATLAAAANVRWGWDYNGILVPGLLSLTLGGPQRLLLTFAESLLLVWAVRLLLRVTRIGHWNLEGPRRPVLFFSLDYALRFALAGAGATFLSSHEANDLMGFGYLLPTLLAVKIARLGLAAPILLPTASVSSAAYVLGTLFGFGAQKLAGAAPGEVVTRQLARAPKQLPLAALWASALARSAPPRGLTPESALDWAEQAQAALERARSGTAGAGNERLEAQLLDGGTLLVRERFQSAERRAGKPSIFFRLDSPSPKTLLVVSEPLSAPLSALVAGRLLAQHQVDALVIAGIDQRGPKSGDSGQALEVARRLASHHGAMRRGAGLVLSLRTSPGDTWQVRAGTRAVADTRLTSIGKALGAPDLGSAGLERPRNAEDAELVLPEALAEAFVAPEFSAPSRALTLAASLDDLECAPTTGRARTIEDELALSRLLLVPLLAQRSAISLPLLSASAAALGFAPPARASLSDGDEALVLHATTAQGATAVVVRVQPGSGGIIELPRAKSPALRRLGLRLFEVLDADAAIVSPCASAQAAGRELFEAAHAEAALVANASGTSFVELRPARADATATGVQLGTWGRAEPLALETELALRNLGFDVTRAPLERAARELGGNDLMPGTALVSLIVPARELREDAWRSTAPLLRAWRWLEQSELPPAQLARQLTGSLPPRSSSPDELLQVARRAALEQSTVAQNSLRALLVDTSARAAVSHSIGGPFLVVVSRGPEGVVVGSFPLAPGFDGATTGGE